MATITTGNTPKALQGGSSKMARLTTADRTAMPASQFALPGQGTGAQGKGAGSYPIDTANRARNALSRVAQNGTPMEQEKVRAKVTQAFPGIGQDATATHNDGGFAFHDGRPMAHYGG